MGYAEGNLEGEEVSVGDIVRVNQAGEYSRMNTYGSLRLTEEDALEVTRVYSTTLIVRTVDTKRVNYEHRRVSFQIGRHRLRADNPNAPHPRRMGEKPEGDEYIGIDHPGIQWLFDDMGKYADSQGWCPQYDALCARLGLPGRPRDFTVTKTIGDIPISATVKARSQREANEMVEKALQGRLPDLEETPANPAPTPDFAPAP